MPCSEPRSGVYIGILPFRFALLKIAELYEEINSEVRLPFSVNCSVVLDKGCIKLFVIYLNYYVDSA
jgi:hypothetical protein